MSRMRLLGAVLVTALAITSVALGATGGTYKGTVTSQQSPVRFRLSKNGKKVSLYVRYAAACPDGSKISDSVRTSTAVKHKRFKAQGGGSSGSNGIETDKAYTVAGRFVSAHKVKGTVDVDYQRFDANGNKLSECKTGKVVFSAKR